MSSLEIEKAEINFTYSCIPAIDGINLSFKNLFGNCSEDERQFRDETKYPGFNIRERLSKVRKDKKGNNSKTKYELLSKYDDLRFKRYRPFCRKGISQYLMLDLDIGFIKPTIFLKNCKLQYNDEKYPNSRSFKKFKDKTTDPSDSINIEIKPIIRIYPNGVSCTIKIIAKDENNDTFRENEINKILHLVGMNQNCAANYKIQFSENNYFGKYNIFTEENNKFFKKEGINYTFTIFNLFKLLTKKCILDPIQDYLKINGSKKKIELLCSKYLVKSSLHKSSNFFEQKETQTPWVTTNIELAEECFSEFAQNYSDEKNEILGTNKANSLKKFQKAIAPLVFRGPDLRINDFSFDDSYYHYSDYESDYLPIYSIHFDNRLFVQMSRRSILTLSRRNGISENYPGKYFIPGLLDIGELVRVRWQTLLLLNYLSDKRIREIRSENFLAFESTDDQIQSNHGLDPIINQIYLLSTCLDSPSSYVVSGDALREIQERLNDTFRLRELTRVVLKKADILEKLRDLKLKKTVYEF